MVNLFSCNKRCSSGQLVSIWEFSWVISVNKFLRLFILTFICSLSFLQIPQYKSPVLLQKNIPPVTSNLFAKAEDSIHKVFIFGSKNVRFILKRINLLVPANELNECLFVSTKRKTNYQHLLRLPQHPLQRLYSLFSKYR
jgi:hypothetical protein